MVSGKGVPFPPPHLFLVSGDVPRFSDQPKVHCPKDEGSSGMSDEGCPNETQAQMMLLGTPKGRKKLSLRRRKLHLVGSAVDYGSGLWDETSLLNSAHGKFARAKLRSSSGGNEIQNGEAGYCYVAAVVSTWARCSWDS
jgi:hypothetical protein